MELETFNQQRSAQELLVSCSRSKPVEVQKRCACFWVEEISGGGCERRIYLLCCFDCGMFLISRLHAQSAG